MNSLPTALPAAPSPAFSRRAVIQGAGIGASALLLAACSTGAPPAPQAATDKSDSQKSLRFDSRDTYRNTTGEDFPLLDQFSTDTGISVTYTNAVSDDNVYYSKVKNQLKMGHDIGADASVLSEWMAARWIRLGYVQEIDREKITNFNNLRLMFQNAQFDPGRRFSLPWRSGFTGIAWNKAAIPGGLAAVSDLWDPALKGRVGVMSAMRDTLGLIMLDAGVDISSTSWGDAEFTDAVNSLRDQVSSGQINAIKGNKYKEDLKSGATVAAIARAGDIMQINQEAGDQWGFALPTAGGVLWSDVAVIPVGSTHRSNAEAFINFYYDRENAVRVAAATSFISPVDVRQPEIGTIPQELSRNEMIFPSEATFNSTKTFRTLTQGEEQRYGAQYQTVLLGAS
ncbi:MAG: spermidine/putrescine ABC transporter substrate-binding protein [Cryobacterium sp.]|nr:spermidine/putrescine ABC transporter substrate-binding protein [Micrococcales bacterium]MBX3079323.1 spermidine/putrescine ABC transporter substrate-binding protein [Cryobacterium sp.]